MIFLQAAQSCVSQVRICCWVFLSDGAAQLISQLTAQQQTSKSSTVASRLTIASLVASFDKYGFAAFSRSQACACN